MAKNRKNERDDERLKTGRTDNEGSRNATENVLTHEDAENLSQEDFHEELGDETDLWSETVDRIKEREKE